MIRAEIIAVGRLRPGPQLTLLESYKKRMQWPLTIHEIEARKPEEEQRKIAAKINQQSYLFVLDERGQNLSSKDFAAQLGALSAEGRPDVQFLIGGADGHTPEIRARADKLLAFGAQTWPHMLARIMLTEQIYRAQQILLGHPYHRD